MCPPSVLKYVTSNFPFSPIPPYQDECLAVFSCCHNYIAEGIIVCVERVAVWDSRYLNAIFKHGIRNWTKRNLKGKMETAETCKKKKKNIINEKWQFFFFILTAVCNFRHLSLRCAVNLTFDMFLIIDYEPDVLTTILTRRLLDVVNVARPFSAQ